MYFWSAEIQNGKENEFLKKWITECQKRDILNSLINRHFGGAVIFQMEKKKNKRKIFGNTSERSKLLHKWK